MSFCPSPVQFVSPAPEKVCAKRCAPEIVPATSSSDSGVVVPTPTLFSDESTKNVVASIEASPTKTSVELSRAGPSTISSPEDVRRSSAWRCVPDSVPTISVADTIRSDPLSVVDPSTTRSPEAVSRSWAWSLRPEAVPMNSDAPITVRVSLRRVVLSTTRLPEEARVVAAWTMEPVRDPWNCPEERTTRAPVRVPPLWLR